MISHVGTLAGFLWLAVVALAVPAAVAAQDQPRFTPGPIDACLSGAPDRESMKQCIGLGASACMQSHDAGGSTIGMGFCFGEELAFWDARLNATYGRLMARGKAADAEMAALEIEVPSQATALRDMQRAWIQYRDAACEFERSQWSNGTGGGPAAVACHMSLTAEQALALKDWLNDG